MKKCHTLAEAIHYILDNVNEIGNQEQDIHIEKRSGGEKFYYRVYVEDY